VPFGVTTWTVPVVAPVGTAVVTMRCGIRNLPRLWHFHFGLLTSSQIFRLDSYKA
jgi:hypothetical protein